MRKSRWISLPRTTLVGIVVLSLFHVGPSHSSIYGYIGDDGQYHMTNIRPEDRPYYTLIEDPSPAHTQPPGKQAIPPPRRVQKPVEPKPRIKQNASQGTGFFVGKSPIVVTCYHVVRSAKRVDIILQDRRKVRGNVLKQDEKNDLALIRFDEFRNVPKGFQIFPSINVVAGQEVYVIGYPMETVLGGSPGITKGIISSTSGIEGDSRHFRITAQINPGNSGGPLLDGQGRLIGVVSHTLNQSLVASATGRIPEGINFAVKSAILLKMLTETNSMINDAEIQPLPPEKIFSTYSNAVVVVRAIE
jgi:uncharacterized protein